MRNGAIFKTRKQVQSWIIFKYKFTNLIQRYNASFGAMRAVLKKNLMFCDVTLCFVSLLLLLLLLRIFSCFVCVCASICLSICLSLSVCLSVCLSVTSDIANDCSVFIFEQITPIGWKSHAHRHSIIQEDPNVNDYVIQGLLFTFDYLF